LAIIPNTLYGDQKKFCKQYPLHSSLRHALKQKSDAQDRYYIVRLMKYERSIRTTTWMRAYNSAIYPLRSPATIAEAIIF